MNKFLWIESLDLSRCLYNGNSHEKILLHLRVNYTGWES